MGFLDSIKNVFSSGAQSKFSQIAADARAEVEGSGSYHWSIKPNNLKTFQLVINLSDKEKVEFIIYAVRYIHEYFRDKKHYTSTDKGYVESHLLESMYQHLLKTKLQWDASDVERIADVFIATTPNSWTDMTSWPLNLFVNQIEKNFKKDGLPDEVKATLNRFLSEIKKTKTHALPDNLKLIAKIDKILFDSQHGQSAVKPTLFLGEDRFVVYANKIITELPDDEKPHWYRLIELAQKASGSKPSSKYLDQSREIFKALGPEKFKKHVNGWFEFIAHLKEVDHQHSYTYGNGQTHNYTSYSFIDETTANAIKGFVWMCAHFHDSYTLQVLASLAERCFKKIPGRGPTAAAVGNACLFTLFKSKGLEGIGHLSRLKLRIKQSSTQSLIDKYLEEAAKQQGVTVAEIEDLAVDDYGLVNAERSYEVEGYKFTVKVLGPGDVELTCYKPDGTIQKSIPSVVKDKASDKIKKIKELVKKIEVSSSAQRDRIDRMLRSERMMTWDYFNEHYFAQGLMSFLAKGIIWKFHNGKDIQEAMFHNNSWRRSNGDAVTPTSETKVSLWHPVTSSVHTIKEWRDFLIDNEIKQPIKQAFREVYILTEAELNTRIYSNRMAAHVIKQHQFNSLAKTRGWKYALLGAYDDGRSNEAAELNLPEYGLRAEYWVNEVNADGQYNDTGIWNYVATDQVRFSSLDTGNAVELINVPKIPFSEIMRDVDLFVGVASVGNDPTWSDSGGVPAFRDYWQSYSFGELSEIAKNRKETLERLLPRLKIAPISSIRDRFLVVKGKLRTYKIHIGSTNILMEPNDQYLCIVPDRSQKPKTDNVFLPFEGDTGLSVVLSKAFLLAEDDKITDTTITSQIKR